MTNRPNRGWRIRGNTAYEFAPRKGRTRGDEPSTTGAKWGEALSPCVPG